MNSKKKYAVCQKKCIPEKKQANTLTSKDVVGMARDRDKVTARLKETNWSVGPKETSASSSKNTQQANFSTASQAFYMPQEEEYCLFQFGKGTLDKFYAYITEKTGANLEFAFLENQGLYATVFGNPETVRKAQKKIFIWCREQDLSTILIPKEKHWFFLGQTGDKAQNLEQNEATNKIICPHEERNCVDNVNTKQLENKSSKGFSPTSIKNHKGVMQKLDMEKTLSPLIAEPYCKASDDVFQETEVHLFIPLSNINEMGIEFIGGNVEVDPDEFCIKEIFEKLPKQTEAINVVRNLPHDCSTGLNRNFLQEILGTDEDLLENSSSEGTSDSKTHHCEPGSSREIFNEADRKTKNSAVCSIYAPSWLHKHIISNKHHNIDKITENVPMVHIHFTDEDKIILKGPVKDVYYAQEQFEVIVKDLMKRMEYAEIKSDCKFHKCLLDNNGATISRISEKHQVSIFVSPEDEKNNFIRIEGESIGVKRAKKELKKLAANSSQDHIHVIFIKHPFHHVIIGRKGERLREICKKFPDVILNFPHSKEKSDIVQLIGPKRQSEKCGQYLEKLVRDIKENNYTITVPISKKLHKRLIGKGGSNIKLISETSNTTIHFPPENSSSEDFVITGYPENCEIARDLILSMQQEIVDTSEEEMYIPSSLHKSLTNSKDCLIASIMDECGKIHMHFPRSKSDLQKVIITGPEESVEKAKKKLMQLTEEEKAKNYSMSVRVKSQYHQFLLNKNGSNISKVCEKTGAHIVLPNPKNEDQELVTIIGKEEAVKDVQKEVELLLKDLENIVEDSILINRKFHHYFVMRKGQLLREMNEEYGGVSISFSYAGKQSTKITIKGPKPCIQAARKHIQDIFEPLGSQVTTRCVIPQKFHSFIMGPICSRIHQISRDYNVQIKFPERAKTTLNIDLAVKGKEKEKWQNSSNEPTSSSSRKCDTIFISGHVENCKAAKEALQSLIPVTAEIHAPSHLHPYIMGHKGEGLRKLIKEFGVHIQGSQPGRNSDIISIMGLAANVEQVKIRLQKRVKALQMEIEEREGKNFKLMFTLDPKYHHKVTGHKGLLLAQICTEHGVTVRFPKKGSHEIQDQIIITGYKENTLAARDAIMRVVHKIENTISKEISISHHVRGNIIGFRGKNIQKIMNQFQVYVRVPPKGSYNTNITLTGLADNVQNAIDHILNLEKYYLSASIEHGPQLVYSRSASFGKTATVPSKSSVKMYVP